MITAPVFLVGSERSGSTLLTHMLDHHPDVAWALALEFAVALLRTRGEWPDLGAYYDYLDTSRIFQTSGLQVDRRLGYVDLIHDFLAQERARKSKRLVGATVHRYFERLPWIFPTCRFIHLVRDPRDVSQSAVGLGFVGNVWRGARWWIDAEHTWDSLRVHVPAERRHEVRYEALINEPETTLRDICRFIGIEYTPIMLSYPHDTNYKAADPGLIEQWRRRASTTEVRIVEAVAGPLMVTRGYRLSGLPSLRIGTLYRCWLREDDRMRRIRFRIARDGLTLTTADFVARHLHLRGYARSVQKRLNANEIRYLQ